MKTNLLDLVKNRRTVYNLGKNVNLDQDELFEYVKDLIRTLPSAFNSQPVRVVMLLNDHHEQLWDLTADILNERLEPNAFLRTKAKLSTFKNAYGTLLFFTDMDVVKEFTDNPKIKTYQYQQFNWSEEAQGNAQLTVWTGLEENGLGVNLQHYDPLINAAVRTKFDIPSNWQLRGEMNFGSIEAPAAEKTVIADEKRFKLFK
ncbi:nitroreductase family protein [Fructilactobacillus vespulae]|uniref:nitroreductase family protein n=1 Tax=Fructilactobacillus vespulae TaxID=1249630 RepID=UPI0039B4DBAC